MSAIAATAPRLFAENEGRAVGEGGRTRYLIGALAALVAALMLAPLVLSFLASIKTQADASAVPPHYLPNALSLEGYQHVLNFGAGLWTYVANSLGVAALTIVLCLALSVPAGFALARFPIPGKNVIFLILLTPLMIPYQALLTPLYLMFAKLGLANSLIGLALVHTILQIPFSVYLMRNAFEAVPRELEEAAVIDGCSTFVSFRRVFLPLVMPGMVTVALFAFIASWNEFLAALIFMNKESAFTVPIMLVSVRTGHLGAVDWSALQAGIMISVLPCVLVYVFLQKYYVSGLLGGAVK
jgi:multiple sugar transport system permease protein